MRFPWNRAEVDLNRELAHHLHELTAEYQRQGYSPEEALRLAKREFGGAEQVKEECREVRRSTWVLSIFQDLRYAGRVFSKSPVFTATALVSLALGIGANSAIFTAADAILWKPLSVRDPGSLLRLTVTREKRHALRSIPGEFTIQFQHSDSPFVGVASANSDGLSFSLDGRAERIMGEAVSDNFFTLLGVQPSLGQAFSEDVRKGQWAAEVVLSYGFWKRRFAGDERVVGRTVHLNKYPFTIVGVAPAGFFGIAVGTEPELWVPVMPPGRELSQMNLLRGPGDAQMARLKPGITVAQAEAAIDAQFQRFRQTLPAGEMSDLRNIRLQPGGTGDHDFVSNFQEPLAVLFGMVGLVLLISCANVASMLLARAAARQRELAVRASIGAGRSRLIRQMLVENLLLWVIGGLMGLAIAAWTNQLVFGFLPQGHIRMVLDLRPDLRAVLFTFGISLASGLLFGTLPALTATRGDLAAALKSDSPGSVGSSFSFRKILVVAQVALSVLLLIVAGLFVRTLVNLRAADFAQGTNRVLLFTMKPQVELYSEQQVRNMTAELVRRVAVLPGVHSVGLAEDGPLGSRGGWSMVGLANGERVRTVADEVSPGFFESVGIRRLAGRDFYPADKDSSQPVVILNDVLAHTLFGRDDPVGRTVIAELRKPQPYQVVGVVSSTRYYDLHNPPPPAIYFAIQQITAYMPTLHVQVAKGHSIANVAAVVRKEFDALDRDVPIFNIKLLEDRVNDSLSRERLVSALAGAFGALALLLAGLGLYGVMAYMVARRTREIGIRVALGSSPMAILWMVGKEALTLLSLGVVAGLAAGMLAARLVSSQLFGLSSADPVSVTFAVTAMLLVTCLATFLPARRAAHVDPMVALRYE